MQSPAEATVWAIGGRRKVHSGVVVQHATLLVLLVLSFVPILLMLSMSFRNSTDIYVSFWSLIPVPLYLQNYTNAMLLLTWPLARTLFVFAISIVGILVFSTISGYVFARLQFPGRAFLYWLILAVMLIPGTIMLTPEFILANQLHLRGSLLGLSVFYIAGSQSFAIFLLRSFFQTQPAEMFESARVDGASELRALWSIAVPLAWPIIITLAIMNFISIYGDLIWPMLMLPDPSTQTLIIALQTYSPGSASAGLVSALPDIGGQAAGYVFASIPQLIVFVFGMRYFIQGLTSGAVKV